MIEFFSFTYCACFDHSYYFESVVYINKFECLTLSLNILDCTMFPNRSCSLLMYGLSDLLSSHISSEYKFLRNSSIPLVDHKIYLTFWCYVECALWVLESDLLFCSFVQLQCCQQKYSHLFVFTCFFGLLKSILWMFYGIIWRLSFETNKWKNTILLWGQALQARWRHTIHKPTTKWNRLLCRERIRNIILEWRYKSNTNQHRHIYVRFVTKL